MAGQGVLRQRRGTARSNRVNGNPVQTGERACLFQHVFNGKFYGYQSRLDHATDKWQMEVLSTPLPN